MTLKEVEKRFREIRPQFSAPSSYAENPILRYALKLENMVRREVLGIDEKIEISETQEYTELSVPEPYSEIYVLYALAMSEFYSGDYTRYNNTIERFNELFEKYKAYYIRNNKPGSSEVKVW